LIVRNIEMVAAQRPDINSALHRPGAFLDIGTGVGWLAIEAARISAFGVRAKFSGAHRMLCFANR
jgi:hypothetical protein